MVLDTFISIAEAAQRLAITESQVRAMVDTGKIKGIVVNGDVVVREKDMKVKQPKVQPIKQPKVQPIKQLSSIHRDDLPEYQQFAHLHGQPIWVTEAARQYGVAQPNISRWIKSGVIKQLGVDKNRLLLDEQDVAYCAYVYHQRNAKRGSWLFRPDGTPYEYRDAPKEALTAALAA
jgi:predicted site-specific integrase-resolvase